MRDSSASRTVATDTMKPPTPALILIIIATIVALADGTAPALYEHDAARDVVRAPDGTELSIGTLAPHERYDEPFTAYLDGGDPVLLPAARVRHGDAHTFVHDRTTGALLAAWGPNLTLTPSTPSTITTTTTTSMTKSHPPSLFTNDNRPALLHGAATAVSRQSVAQPPERTHVFTSELKLFLDAAFNYDASFCALFGGNGTRAAQLVNAAAVTAHRIAFATVVSVRISFVSGYCSRRSDPFSTAASLPSPAAVLAAFGKQWRKRRHDVDVDVAYLVTARRARAAPAVVGAAYVGAACSPGHAFGWLAGAHPVVIAHEMAHSLGAPHDKRGLMAAALDLSAPPAGLGLSEQSKRHIQGYADAAAHTCLATRHATSPGGRRRFSSFVRIARNQWSEGSDVTFYAPGASRPESTVSFFVVNVYKKNTSTQQLFVQAGAVRRAPNPDRVTFPFAVSFNFSAFRVNESVSADHSAGAAVAATSLGGWWRPDVAVVFMAAPRRMVYKVGFAFDTAAKSGFRRGSSPRIIIPLSLPRVMALGATFRGRDLFVTYASSTHLHLIIGRSLGTNGVATSGWTTPIRIASIPARTKLGDLSPAMLGPRLLVAFTLRRARWVQRFVVGDFDAKAQRWRFRTRNADLVYRPDPETQRLTGGVASVQFKGARSPSALLYHSRQFASGNTQWVEFGDDILAALPPPPRHVAAAGMLTPGDACAVCYPTTPAACVSRFASCFAARSSFALAQVSAKSTNLFSHSRPAKTSRMANLPHTDTIFCAGVAALYMNAGTRRCGSRHAVNPNELWSAGVQSLLRDDGDFTRSTSVTQETDFGPVRVGEWFVNFGGAAGSIRLPVVVRVSVKDARYIRRAAVRNALRKVRSRPDFSSVFQKPKAGYVKRIGNGRYIVILRFRSQFEAEFLSNLRSRQ